MAVRSPVSKLVKSKSQELILDDMDPSSSPSSAFTKMRKVFRSSPILKKKRTASSNDQSFGICKTFGVPLTQLLTGVQGRQNDSRKLSLPVGLPKSRPYLIPPVVTQIVNHIETHGLDQEGIYRINGNNKLVERLKILFNEDDHVDLTDTDIYSIGSLLKLFLRMLPTPLVPDDVSQRVIKLQESISSGGSYSSEDTLKLKEILATLPSENHQLLKYLCKHLFFVSEHKDKNKMTSVSLSIVFGPNIFRCGGELIDLKNQGYANSAFAYMIQCHDTIFESHNNNNTICEQDELKATSTASDDVFTTDDEPREERKKPDIPLPYHEHKLKKTKSSTSSQGSMSVPTSPVHPSPLDFSLNEPPVSPTSERSIDEAIAEAEERKKQAKTSAVSIPKLTRNKSLSDDILINRGPSPSSWNSKSSPGTSPATSPPLTPRTSQAYTTLLGDSIQDHLFTPDSRRPTSEEGHTTAADEVPYQVLPSSSEATTTPSVKSSAGPSTSNESVQSRDFSIRRRNNARRNRKSAVYGSDSSLDTTHRVAMTEGRKEDQSIELYTVNESASVNRQELKVSQLTTDTIAEKENTDRETESTPSAKSIRDIFEKKGVVFQMAGKNIPIKSLAVKESDDTGDSSTVVKCTPPQVAKKPIRKSIDEQQQMNNYVAHDFDHVSEKVKTLTHLTKQRVRGPHNRAKPSRPSSTTLVNTSNETVPYDTSVDMIDASTVGTETIASTTAINDANSTVFANDSNVNEMTATHITPSSNDQDIIEINRLMSATPITEVMTCLPITIETTTLITSTVTPNTSTTPMVIATHSSTPIMTTSSITPIVTATPFVPSITPAVTATSSTPSITPTVMATPLIAPIVTTTPSALSIAPVVTATPSISPVVTVASNTQTMAIPITQVATITPMTVIDQIVPSPITQDMTTGPIIAPVITPNPVTQTTAESGMTATSIPLHITPITAVTASPLVLATTDHTPVTALVMTAVPTATSPSMATQNSLILSPVTSPSHVTVLTSPSHQTPQIGPIHNVSLVPAGWTADDDESKELSYEELIAKAKKLKQVIRTFHENFIAQNGRKPTIEESSPVAHENSSLTIIKKKLRALRSKQRDTLNKTAPPQITTKTFPMVASAAIQMDEPLTSLSAVKIDDTLNDAEKTTDATVRRHQSLSIPLSHSRNATFTLLIQGIQKGLEEKREQAGRPEKLEEMSYDQLLQEKHLIQKTLLNFEKKHGKPQSSDNKAIIKPLYNRYRQIKQMLSSGDEKGPKSTANRTIGSGDRSLYSATMLPPATPPPSAPPTLSSFTIRDQVTTTYQQLTTQSIRRGSSPAPAPSPPPTTTEGVMMSKRGRFMSAGTIGGASVAHTKRIYSKSVSQVLPNTGSWMSNEQLKSASIGQLQEQLILAQTRKKEQREKLRLFELGFQEREKRPVDNADKKRLMHSEYTHYKALKNRIALLDSLISRHGLQTTM